MTTRRMSIGVALALVVFGSATTRAGPLALRDRQALNELDVLRGLVLINAKEAECRPNDDEIETAAAFVLRQTNWRYVPSNQFSGDNKRRSGTLLITGDVLKTQVGCVYQVEMSVLAGVTGKLDHNEQPWSGQVELWETAYIGIVPPSNLTRKFVGYIESALKELTVAVEVGRDKK